MRILLIEDDLLIGDGIKVGLTKLGFCVDWFTEGTSGCIAAEQAPYDAVVLDLSLPQMDGLTILSSWRKKKNNIPVLILTARDSLEQRVSGLHAGADDYLCKPFALVEVAARLQALIRRSHGQVNACLTHGSICLDQQARSVTLNNESVALTPKEINLLELLLHNKGRVLSRTQLQEKLSTWDEDISSNALEVHIHHLRKKLGNQLIKTVHGIGYSLGAVE